MNRLGLRTPDELTPAQHECYKVMKDYTTTNYGQKFTYMDSQSRLVGPFGIHLHYPLLGQVFIEFAKALRSIPDFPAEVRECAILGVGSRMGAAYEQYDHIQTFTDVVFLCSAHEHLSGFSADEQKLLHSGQCPETFSPAQKIAYKVAIELGKPGPLDENIWRETTDILGRDGAAALIHYVGFYVYVSTVLNGFDAKIPI